MIDTHSKVPQYFYKNYALVCEKGSRAPGLPLSDRNTLVQEAIKYFKLYIENSSGDPQTPAIHNLISSLQSQLEGK